VITGFAAVLAAGWTGAALAGGVDLGTLHLSPLAAAVGCGATALAVALRPGTVRGDLVLAPALLVGLPCGAALAVDGHTALPLLGCVVVSLVAAAPRWRTTGWSLTAGVVGAGLVATALALARNDLHAGVLTVEGDVAEALLGAAALALAVAAAVAPDDEDVLRVLVLPAVVIGWVVAPGVDGMVVAAAVLALVMAALVVTRRSPGPLAFATIALAAIGPARPGAALLGAAVILITAVGPVLAWPTALPGAVAAALAMAAGPGRVDDVVAGAAVIVALAAVAVSVRGPAVLRPRALPAAALALWLAVAPATWTWAGATGLTDYQQGAARAVAAGLLVSVAAWMTGQLRPPAPEWHNDGW
jgi:hypothetical protein